MSASSLKSARLPLSDRSNNPTSANSSNDPTPASPPTLQPWHVKQVRRKLSNRQLFPNIDSSEETPSEHSSIYDAIYWTPDEDDAANFTHNKENVPESDEVIIESVTTHATVDTLDGGARFINRPRGTPLETIIEQNSYATLRTKPSLPNTKRLYTPIHLDTTSPYALQQHGALRRKISFSVNDTDMYDLIDEFPEPPTETDVHRSLSIKPPQPPPARMPTPKGLPRWPGDLPAITNARPARRRRSFRGLFHAFRTSSAPNGSAPHTGFGHALRTADARTVSLPATGRSYWRPPRSGQLTHDNLEAHPFHNAPVAAVRNAGNGGETRPASRRSSHDANVFDHPIPSPAASQLRSLQSRFTFNDRPTPTIRLVTPTSPILSACDDSPSRGQGSPTRDSSLLQPSIRRVSGTPPPRVQNEEHMDRAVLLNQEGADMISSLNLQDIAVLPVVSGALENSIRSHFSDSTTSHTSKPAEVHPYASSSSSTSLRTYTTTPLPHFHTHSQHTSAPATLYPSNQPSHNNSTNTFQSFRTSSLQTALSTSSTSSLSFAPAHDPQNEAPLHHTAAHPASLHPALFPTHLTPFFSAYPTQQNSTPLRAERSVRATGKTSTGSFGASSLLQHPRPARDRGLSLRRVEWITPISSGVMGEEEEGEADTDMDAEGNEAVCGVGGVGRGGDGRGEAQRQGQGECPHRLGGNEGGRFGTKKRDKMEERGDGTDTGKGKGKCWRCSMGEKSREVVCWVLGYCFCQQVEGYGYAGGSGRKLRRKRAMGMREREREGRGTAVVGWGRDGAADQYVESSMSGSVSVLEPARVVV